MIDAPTAAEIAASVARWRETRGADVSDFEERVAANALGIAEREAALWPAAEARAVARLRALTGPDGGFAALEAALAAMIRAREIAPTDPALIGHLIAAARDRLAIDQPSYVHDLGESE